MAAMPGEAIAAASDEIELAPDARRRQAQHPAAFAERPDEPESPVPVDTVDDVGWPLERGGPGVAHLDADHQRTGLQPELQVATRAMNDGVCDEFADGQQEIVAALRSVA